MTWRGHQCGIGLSRAALPFLLFALISLFGRQATAQEVSAHVDTQVVGVGDELHLTLKAMSQGRAPSDPQPGSTKGFTITSNSIGPTQSISIVNGSVSQRQGITATWTLHADKQGTFTIGPPSASFDGTRVGAQAIRVNVVPAGQAPRPRPGVDPFGNPFSTFDPFKGLFDGFPEEPRDIPTDPKLALDAARGQVAFLHATVDKTSAVVGEQVTLTVYIYVDAGEREPDLTDVHEATANDFVKRSLFEDDQHEHPVGRALAGGRVWNVKLIRKSALFPLKAGELELGPMSLALVRARLAGDPLRESEGLTVHVTEPPLEGRPPGYVVGDVGNFSLTGQVTPRELDRDGAVGVTIELSGTGNLPAMLTPPARTGLEWLPPEVHEKMGATGADRYGGKRTFAFVLRLHKEGEIDLGDMTLPFYNPDSHRYGVARAALGTIIVHPGAVAAASADPPFDPLAGLPEARSTLGRTRTSRAHLTDNPLFWLGLGAAPLAYAMATGAAAAGRRIRRARAARATSPETEMRRRVAEAERASASGDARTLDSATVRALLSATIARVNVNVRDARGDEIARRLLDAGVAAEVAERVRDLLHECEASQFAPLAEAENADEARKRWEAARGLVLALKRGTV
jgi:hypothetical protein